MSLSSDDEDMPLTFKRSNSIAKKPPPISSGSMHQQANKTEGPVKRQADDRGAVRLQVNKSEGSVKRQATNQGAVNGQGSNQTKNQAVSGSTITADKGVSGIKSPPGKLASYSRTSDDKAVSSVKVYSDRAAPSVKVSSDRVASSSKMSSAAYAGSSLSLKLGQSNNPPEHRLASKVVENVKSIKHETNYSYDSDDEKPLSSRFSVAQNAPQPPTGIRLDVKTEDSDDSSDDDNIPLSCKYSSSTAAPKAASTQLNLPISPEIMIESHIKKCSYDSEDEKPLISRLQSKTGSGPSTVKMAGSSGNPLAHNIKQNGSMKESDRNLLSPKNGNKRPINDNVNSAQISIKKAKVSTTSSSFKIMKESLKEETEIEDKDDIPISQRIKKSASSSSQSSGKKLIKKSTSLSVKKDIKKTKKTVKGSGYSKSLTVPPGSGGGQKWTTLEHSGVIFPPPYKPHGVKMLYNGHSVDLTPEQEEVATMFAVMKETDYATKPKFIDNFWNDWKQILGTSHTIKKFELCDFTPIYDWQLQEKEKKKQMSSDEKKAMKEEKLKQEEKYMWAIVDGKKEKVGNFRVEPPGLFRGRGEHPKMGKLKTRIQPKDITINIGKHAPIPECPIVGGRWKEVRHDNTVTWLAYWNDPINSKEFKYVFLAASSTLKGQSDKEKYEKARLLKNYIHDIRANYTRDFNSKDATKRQIAVATYLIDKLALRAGNEKDDDEADTVGCCTLKVENVELIPPNKIQFDFLGKDSIRYFNTVEVELAVYKAIGDFRTERKVGKGQKSEGDDLFDLLDTNKLNTHLKELMPGLTAKVFRTYNASITLDDMLSRETREGILPEKIAVYQQANKEVAIICNHQRSVSKSHENQMLRLDEKIDALKNERDEIKENLIRAKKGKPLLKDSEGKSKKILSSDGFEKKLNQLNAKIENMELNKKVKEDLKTVALGTSKINYLDPRITVAWCKRHEVPIEKIFNKSLLAKFTWAMSVDPDFRF